MTIVAAKTRSLRTPAALLTSGALALFSTGCARTDLGVPEQRHACVPIASDGPTRQVVSAEVAIDRSDILFLIDNSTSMADEIEQISEKLVADIVPSIADRVHDAQFGVAVFSDFGSQGVGKENHPYQLLQPITDDVRSVLTALEHVELEPGGDAPESQLEALYQVATGEGLGAFIEPGPDCEDGARAGVCFRPGAFAVTMLFTDAPMRQVTGIGADGRLSPVVPDAPSYDGPVLHENLIRDYDPTIEALQAEDIRVVGLWSGVTSGLDDLRRVVRDTGAVDPSGQPIVVDIGAHGDGLGIGVVQSLELVTSGTRLDVQLELTDADRTDGVDSRALVVEVRAARAEPADGATSDGPRFTQVRSGTRVFFELVFDPTRVPQAAREQRYPLGLRVLASDGTLLFQETVDVVIAAQSACTAPEPTAR